MAGIDKGDRLNLADELDVSFEPDDIPRWKVLVVDDEEEIHNITRLALRDFRFSGRELEFVSAYSGAEAQTSIMEHPDVAIILLDVVMETDDAGLLFARFIRQTVGNQFVRIILRTGQSGMAPERQVMKVFDINDYRAKTELT
ncbi:MAG: CheY-like chemotaxis protein [Paracoccaceae bacterium]|jgi:CheY-like chemotaxis protein